MRVGDYILDRELGRSDLAKVKLGLHCSNPAAPAVAVKVFKEKHFPAAHKSFSKEKAAYERLKPHPNVLRYHSAHSFPDRVCLVLEYAPHGDLLETYASRRLPEPVSKRWFRQLCLAVAHCHASGVVHRDVKLENALLDQDYNVQLCDFGMAAVSTHSGSSTTDIFLSTLCGSPTYAAPELLSKQRYRGPPVDVWALGVCLFAMLCSCFPFDDDDMPALYAKIQSGKYPTPGPAPPLARDIIADMLALIPDRRAYVDQVLGSPWFATTLSDDEWGAQRDRLLVGSPLANVSQDSPLVPKRQPGELVLDTSSSTAPAAAAAAASSSPTASPTAGSPTSTAGSGKKSGKKGPLLLSQVLAAAAAANKSGSAGPNSARSRGSISSSPAGSVRPRNVSDSSNASAAGSTGAFGNPSQQLLDACEAGDLESVLEAVMTMDEREFTQTRGRHGVSPLHLAVRGGHLACVRCLLDNGFDPNVKMPGPSATPMHWAVMRDEQPSAEASADPRRTPDRNACLVALLEAGGDPNEPMGAEEWTPLHLAAMYGHIERIFTLLADGADIGCRDSEGRTAMDLAQTDTVREAFHRFRKLSVSSSRGSEQGSPNPRRRTVADPSSFGPSAEAQRKSSPRPTRPPPRPPLANAPVPQDRPVDQAPCQADDGPGPARTIVRSSTTDSTSSEPPPQTLMKHRAAAAAGEPSPEASDGAPLSSASAAGSAKETPVGSSRGLTTVQSRSAGNSARSIDIADELDPATTTHSSDFFTWAPVVLLLVVFVMVLGAYL